MDPIVNLNLMTALRKMDERLTAGERKRGHVVNPYRFAHYCDALGRIQERVKAGEELRAAILGEVCGAVARGLLRAAKLAPMTKDEDR